MGGLPKPGREKAAETSRECSITRLSWLCASSTWLWTDTSPIFPSISTKNILLSDLSVRKCECLQSDIKQSHCMSIEGRKYFWGGFQSDFKGGYRSSFSVFYVLLKCTLSLTVESLWKRYSRPWSLDCLLISCSWNLVAYWSRTTNSWPTTDKFSNSATITLILRGNYTSANHSVCYFINFNFQFIELALAFFFGSSKYWR